MAKKRQQGAQSPQRPLDLNTVKAFWDIMSRHFGDMPIDLSLFNYKASTDGKPLVRQAVREKVPLSKAYDSVLELLDEYHKGEDILWRPSKAHYSSSDWTSMLWLDDFKPDNDLGLVPLIVIQTSPEKYQAFFRLISPVLVEKADELQKALARLIGDKGAGSFFQHRRMAGLANGKYDDDPICILYGPDEESPQGYIDPTVLIEKLSNPPARAGVAEIPAPDTKGQEGQRTQGRYVRPVVPVDYRPVFYRPRDEFIKRREDGTIDESATDMAWATHYVRWMTRLGWDDTAIGFTVFTLLAKESPELKRRKKTGDHALDYLFRTIWRAIDLVKKTPDREKDEDTGDIEDLLDGF